MLSIFLFIGIGSTFARKAFDKDRSRGLWATIGIISYFLMQFVAGVFIFMMMPELLSDDASVLILNLVTGFGGVGIAYYILHRLPDLREEIQAIDDDLLDSNLS
jgi:drug/metabolite transporter (DMT)-like permease